MEHGIMTFRYGRLYSPLQESTLASTSAHEFSMHPEIDIPIVVKTTTDADSLMKGNLQAGITGIIFICIEFPRWSKMTTILKKIDLSKIFRQITINSM